MIYNRKKIFLLGAFLLSCGLALVLALPHDNLTAKIDEIGIDILMLWGLPLLPILIFQAGNNLAEKNYPDVIYIRLFTLFWLVSALSVVFDELY